jgi:predicted nucleic acid-binding protein
MMNVVDSSGWIEYFLDGENSQFFAASIEDTANLIVPTICIYEVFKRLSQMLGEGDAQEAISFMASGSVVDLTQPIALSAAKNAIENRLAMADSIILATAREHNAMLWTQDKHFKEITGVQFFEKP